MRTVSAFVIGLIVGAVTTCAGLWATGNLQALGPGLSVAFRKPLSPPATLPDVNAVAPLPSPPVPPEGGAILPPPQADADRVVSPPAEASIGTVPPANLHLAMPLQGIDVTKLPDTYNDARAGHMHEALDIMAPRGTPIMAVAEGNVAKLFTSKQGGLTVYQFDNSAQYCYYYAHLDRYAPGLKEGMLLRKGDVLGYVGSTGDARQDAPHLHLAVFRLGPEKKWWEGTPINPLPLLK
jgi:murein DD-endopeptidase MepM/ murein hydrolase activator NlpD